MSYVTAAAAIVGAYSSYHNGKQAKKAQQPLINAQVDLSKQMGTNLKTLAPYSQAFYQRAGEAYDPAAAYYKAAAAGGPSLLRATAPELNTIGTKYNSIISAQRELQPRTGTSAAFNAALPFQAGNEQQGIINHARTDAIGNLAQLAGTAGNLGASAGGLATSSGVGAGGLINSAIGNQFGLSNAIGQSNAETGSNLSDAAGAIFGGVKNYTNGKKSPSTTGSASSVDVGLAD